MEEKDHPDGYQHKVQKPVSVMVWSCINAHGIIGNCNICEGTIYADRSIQVVGQNMLPSRQCLFQGRHSLFEQYSEDTFCRFTTPCLRSKECTDGPASSSDLFPIENVKQIMKRKIRQKQKPQTVEQIKIYTKQWKGFPLSIVLL